MKNFGPLHPKVKRILHGGDYNPDQWLDYPEVLSEDLRLMKLAKVNALSLNIFGWTALEPQEGKYRFDWLDERIASLHKQGAQVVLATPSGAKPAWMSKKYPEIRRVERNGLRQPHGGRHNHCYSSPLYRQKVWEMNTILAKRYGRHPALVLWHINNEYNAGECHCEHCYARFREWLKQRYGSLERLNHQWWNHFWSHAYGSWEEVEAKDPENLIGELDFRRFISDNCLDFYRHEVGALKAVVPEIPATTNFMGAYYGGLDYWKLSQATDVCSWDSYPSWHVAGDDAWEACATALSHDVMRSMKGGKPFVLMESTPQGTNWMEVGKAKKPGMHLASSLQALARGSDAVMYFQWRKGRGSYEQHHGAVVDHEGSERTRTFKEVAELGGLLEGLAPLIGTGVPAEAALLWDWESRWALELAKGPRNRDKHYERDAQEHYFELWRRGIPVDAVSLSNDLSRYKLLLAPSLYTLTADFAERLRAFVRAGGILVTGYLAGSVDEQSLAHLGGRPGPIRDVMGVWAEETDALSEADAQAVKAFGRSFKARHYADILHLEGARALGSYARDWYAGSPALTVNAFGKGQAYYVASRNEQAFLSAFYERVLKEAGLKGVLKSPPPAGVELSLRQDEKARYTFAINFSPKIQRLALGPLKGKDLLTGKSVQTSLSLRPLGAAVIQSPL